MEVGENNRVQFDDKTSTFVIVIRKDKYKLIDKCDYKKFPQNYSKEMVPKFFRKVRDTVCFQKWFYVSVKL